MKLSGPLKKVWMPASASIGIRLTPISRIGSTCSMSSGSWSKQNPSGMRSPSGGQGFATGSKAPSIILPASSL